MRFKRLNISDSVSKMELWKENSTEYLDSELDQEYTDLRQKLLAGFSNIEPGHKYRTDYQFGYLLYVTLEKFGFTQRDAADDDKWRFLSLCVIPDLVAKRWGKSAEIRYYKQGDRIWLKTIWWYIHLSKQPTLEETVKVIANNTTDEILNLVDRIGRNGYNIEVFRFIMYYYWKARQVNTMIGSKDFRRVMILHTALNMNVIPDLCMGGSEGYVKLLFNMAGVEVDG